MFDRNALISCFVVPVTQQKFMLWATCLAVLNVRTRQERIEEPIVKMKLKSTSFSISAVAS